MPPWTREFVKKQLEKLSERETFIVKASPFGNPRLPMATDGNNNHAQELRAPDLDNRTMGKILTAQEESGVVLVDSTYAGNTEDGCVPSELAEQNRTKDSGGTGQQLMDRVMDQKKSFDRKPLKIQFAELEEYLSYAIEQNKKLRSKNEQLRAQNKSLATRLIELNKRLRGGLRERGEQRRSAEGGSLANSTKETDDTIRAKWKMLGYNIRTLACFLAKGSPSYRLDQAVKVRLQFVSPSFDKYLQDDDYRDLVIQAYLWHMVNDKVFDADSHVWGGPGAAAFKSLQDSIINRIGVNDESGAPNYPLQQAAGWLAQGSSILNRLWGDEPRCLADLVNAETKLLQPFFLSQQVKSDGEDKRVHEELKVIIETAVEIDQMTMCSKAIFQIHWRDSFQNPLQPHRFNSGRMAGLASEKDLSSESIVKMVVSPFLYKTGNADGQNYDCRMLLAKAGVVCD